MDPEVIEKWVKLLTTRPEVLPETWEGIADESHELNELEEAIARVHGGKEPEEEEDDV